MKPSIVVAFTSAPTPAEGAAEIIRRAKEGAAGARIAGGIVYHTVSYGAEQLRDALRAGLPGVPLLGATSCAAVGTAPARFASGASAVGWFLVGDGFRFGVGAASAGLEGETTGRCAAEQALAAAGFTAEKARFMVVHPTPGDEEALLRGAFGAVNKQTAIIGGSAADDDLTGRWQIWTHDFIGARGVALAVCDWPWKLGIRYQAGYLPTDKRGKVTAVRGRTVLSIDGRPAAEVYNEWVGGALTPYLARGGSVLDKTTLSPLGATRRLIGGMETYVLVHPERVVAEGRALTLFANVEVGQDLVLMTSSPDALVQRSAQVASTALGRAGLESRQLVGALLVYCAGCMLTIKPRMSEMLAHFERPLSGVPYASVFTFGEQGCVLPGQVDHGNLMACVLLLSAS